MNKKFPIILLVLGLFLKLSSQVPIVFRISEGIRPNSLISLYGEYLTGAPNVKFVQKDGTVAASVNAVQTDPAGRFCRVVFPPSIAQGSYAVYVQNANGWSANPLYINKADPRWISEERTYAGLKMKLMGRNLDASQYGGLSNTWVQLVPSGRGKGTIITPSKTTPYCVDFTIPKGLSDGTYYVEVKTNSAEYGADWVRLNNASESPAIVDNTILTVESAPSDAMALAMGVTWAKDFNWTFTRNVRNTPYNATGNGTIDDTQAIQNAINDVSANSGGGVVFIPNGTYIIVAGLQMKKNVIIRGESNVNTILVYSPVNPADGNRYYMIKSDGDKDDLSSAKRTGMQGFCNLKATIRSGSNPKAEFFIAEIGCGRAEPWPRDGTYLTATKMFVFRCTVDLPFESAIWQGFEFGGAGPVLEAENSFKVCTPPWDHAVKKYFVLRDNTFDYCNAQVSLSSDRLLLYNNKLTVHKVTGIRAEVHGFFLQEPIYQFAMWNCYVSNNSITGCFSTGNKSEAIAFDSPMYKQAGQSTASSTTTVDINNYKNSPEKWDQPWQIIIVDGKGMGQMRSLISRTDNGGGSQRFTVNRTWDVQPDNSSKIVVCSIHTGAVAEGNSVTDNVGFAYIFWAGAYDCIFNNNTARNTEGIDLYGTFWDSGVWDYYTPLQFCQIRRNTLTGKSAAQNYSSVCLTTDDENGTAWAPAIYGTELRENSIDRSDCSDTPGWQAPVAAGFCSSTARRITGGTSILASLYEGNTIKNSKYGISLCNRESSAVIRGTTFININTQNINDNATNTIQLSDNPR